ncbi:sodium:solute symporter [Flavobacterium frigoris]|uniref:Sodium/iodide co-transporter n=1 Tax=Flavobacterium frigoris (strain PS1) TaxID=1086011 RepID=H7FT38_FLAFP|nr:sodium:solute symporter [Flavobacterium frigoris]EIA08735.1 sodium/iodide co-transporter [Flavobacterium frigoris PS1]
MTPSAILILIIIYFGVLFFISHYVSRNDSGNEAFFKANKNSKWYLVAFGMIGTALSGVTFISVPGEVGAPSGEQFKYFQFVLGNAIGFIIITKLLLPLYYRMNLTSIYSYIEKRMGNFSYKTAASIFLISRTVSSAFRLYLVVIVLQRFVFDFYKIPFAATVLISLLLIYSYTYRGGLKTIIITDTLQTFFLVTSVFLTIYFICDSLNLSASEAFTAVKDSSYSKVFFFDDFMTSKYHFAKQILGGMFVTIAMVGLDQDLMQKNLSCKNIKEAQKNMLSFTAIFVIINIFFLSVGALLYIYANKNGIAIPIDAVTNKPRTDLLFPEIALNHLSIVPSIVFLLGLIAATFATTDSALTALTTSFCVDFLGMDKEENMANKNNIRNRHIVHLAFSAILFIVILVFNSINDSSVVGMIFKVASYTYGPLLGLYAFGLFQKSKIVKDKLVPIICLLAPFFTYLINENSKVIFNGYVFDNELIIINGMLTYIGLYLTSSKATQKQYY